MGVEWFLIDCEQDNSLSLIPSEDVTFDKHTVSAGSRVKFTYNGQQYDGLVLNFGDEDDYVSLKTERDARVKERKLSAKRAASFHEDNETRPSRAAALKGRDLIQTYVVKPNKRSLPLKHSEQTPSANKVKEDAPVDSPEDGYSSSSSDSEPAENNKDDRAMQLKVYKKSRNDDFKILQEVHSHNRKEMLEMGELSQQSQDPTDLIEWNDQKEFKKEDKNYDKKEAEKKEAEKEEAEKKEAEMKELRKKEAEMKEHRKKEAEMKEHRKKEAEMKEHRKKEAEMKEHRKKETEMKKDKKEAEKKKDKKEDKKKGHQEDVETDDMKPASPKKSKTVHVYSGAMFRYSSTDEEVNSSEISGIFISEAKLTSAKAKHSATELARALVKAVFTDAALLSSSLGGHEAHGLGAGSINGARPSLDPDALKAILDYTIKRQKVKKWTPAYPLSVIKQSLRVMLAELRTKEKKRLSKLGKGID